MSRFKRVLEWLFGPKHVPQEIKPRQHIQRQWRDRDHINIHSQQRDPAPGLSARQRWHAQNDDAA